MADLPDYYTQAQISEAEAASVKGGLDANKSATPVSRDIYLATDTSKLYYCVTDGTWVDVTYACLLLAGGTMTGAIAMGGNKVTGLGAPAATDDALRYNRAEIRNAEIAAAAAILRSKLNFGDGLVNADIAAAAAIVESKLSLDVGTSTLNTKIGTDIATHAALRTAVHGIVQVVKASDDTVNNTTTLANDSELLFAIAINEIWEFTIVILYNSGTTPDIKFAITVPTNATIEWSLIGRGTTDAVAFYTTIVSGTAYGAVGKGADWMVIIKGIAAATDTAGNVQLQFAQYAANESDTKVLTNSCLIAHKLV